MGLPALCTQCKARKYCKTPCPPVDSLADGNEPLREALIDIDLAVSEYRDYKEALAELQSAAESRERQISIADIRAIPDISLRLIAAASYAEIPIKTIANHLHLSRRTIYYQLDNLSGPVAHYIRKRRSQ